jgi:hypothetical protein
MPPISCEAIATRGDICRIENPRVVDPDWIRIQRLFGSGSVLGIRIPDPGARKWRNFSGKMHFLVIFNKNVTTEKVKIALTTFWKNIWNELHRYFWFDLTKILISKKFEKKIVFESSVLAWIEQKCWIRIRIRNKSIRIHNPGKSQCSAKFLLWEMGRLPYVRNVCKNSLLLA